MISEICDNFDYRSHKKTEQKNKNNLLKTL